MFIALVVLVVSNFERDSRQRNRLALEPAYTLQAKDLIETTITLLLVLISRIPDD